MKEKTKEKTRLETVDTLERERERDSLFNIKIVHSTTGIARERNDEHQLQNGITLIALVVTIVVLLILMGITINIMFSNQGIFKQAEKARIEQRKAEVLEQLTIAEADNSVKQLNKVTLENYLKEIYEKMIVVKEYTIPIDETNCTVITEDGLAFKVSQVGIDIQFEYVGQRDDLSPYIKVLETTTNSIKIEVKGNGNQIQNCTYYYKLQSDENYDTGTNTTETKHKFTGLTENAIYDIKVVIETSKGIKEITKNILVGKVPEGTIILKNIIWINGKATIALETSEIGYTLQYQVDNRDGIWLNYNESISNLEHGTTVYARLWDGSQGGKHSSISVIDKEKPQTATISFNSTEIEPGGTITMTVTHIDNESGINIGECKWIYNKSNVPIGTEESKYTGGNFSSNSQIISLNIDTIGEYYLHILSVDMAGNKKETISKAITVKIINVANPPKLGSGMTPIKWNGTTWIETLEEDDTWYDYTDKKWANAKTADGSMWVWIPRYAYQIASNWHKGGNGIKGIINIKFLKGTTDEATNGTVNWDNASGEGNWNIHPAFTNNPNNGGWDAELSGIWVAKFEASHTECTTEEKTGKYDGIDKTLQIKPGVTSWKDIMIKNAYTVCLNYNTVLNSHMMKNSEWGAVAYLTQSIYGKNGKVEINLSSCTGGGIGTAYATYNVAQSTTGNIYGIYDMNGGAYEFTASYVNNGNTGLQAYGESLYKGMAKTKNVYRTNFYEAADRYGDAIYETSCTGAQLSSWYGESSEFPSETKMTFIRGGCYFSGGNSARFV